jgi:hypothetical protein
MTYIQSPALKYARTGEGFELPVLDVSNPSFAIPDEFADLDAVRASIAAEMWQRRFIPTFVMRLMFRAAARNSRLLTAIVDPKARYLDGISTYVMKLGADNLVPPFDAPIDRRLAGSPHCTLMRLRTRQTACLLARAIADDAAFASEQPLHLINIGGGPALDSANALVLLRRSHPQLLNRKIVIQVLDGDSQGALFGSNALAALQAAAGPLEGVEAVLVRRDYDWNEQEPLRRLMQEVKAAGGIAAVSTEGALFEYGSDAAIVENLRALREGGVARHVVGSVTNADPLRRRMIALSGFDLIARGIDGFRPLAARAGFAIADVRDAVLSSQVHLHAA